MAPHLSVVPDAIPHSGPQPGARDRSVVAASIEQLFCEARLVKDESSHSTFYDVSALLKDGKKRKLLKNLVDLDQALFIEQRLENAMKIQDARVPGELAIG